MLVVLVLVVLMVGGKGTYESKRREKVCMREV